MRVYIHERRLAVDAASRDRVDRRLGFALGQFGGRVGRVDVHLSSVNGPWGGGCMRCRVVVEVLGHGPVVVEGDDHDLIALIDRAADRAGQAVRRRLDWNRLYAGLADPTPAAVRN